MISGAVYHGGIARTLDGAVYIVQSPGLVPITAVPCKGASVAPRAKALNSDGAVYVRFI